MTPAALACVVCVVACGGTAAAVGTGGAAGVAKPARERAATVTVAAATPAAGSAARTPVIATVSAAPAPVNVTVSAIPATQYDTDHAVAPLPVGFVGVSMEYCEMTPSFVESLSRPDGPLTANPVVTVANPVLRNLIAGLAPGQRPVLRIGGDSADQADLALHTTHTRIRDCPFKRFPLTAGIIGAIGALAHSLDAQLILGINLKKRSPAAAAAETAALLAAIDPKLPYSYIEAFEVGNEPDLLRIYNSPSGFAEYFHDFESLSAAIRRAAGDPGMALAGPSLGELGVPWINGANVGQWSRLLGAPAHPQLITFHTYPLIHALCPGVFCPSLANLLAQHSSHGLAEEVAPFVATTPPGRGFRVDEMNSVTSEGKRGISDTFASALWALDTLFEFEASGVNGVNVQTIPDVPYALFDRIASGSWVVRPEYYGLLTFALASPPGSQLLSVSSEGHALKVWATQTTGGPTRIVIINKGIDARRVVLRGSAIGEGPVTIERLLAPRNEDSSKCVTPYLHTGICATAGITLGGRSFGPPARGRESGDRTSSGVLTAPQAAPLSTCASSRLEHNCVVPGPVAGLTVSMPPASAAVLTEG